MVCELYHNKGVEEGRRRGGEAGEGKEEGKGEEKGGGGGRGRSE